MKKFKLKAIKRTLTESVNWIGLPEEQFTYYESFVNRVEPGICGTYAAAALTHYITEKKQLASLSMEQWLAVYKPEIEERFPYTGTFWWDVVRGLKKRFPDELAYQVRCRLVSETTVVRVLQREEPLPLIVGTLSVLGSPYQNHWLLVYAYAYDSKGKLWFKAYDNHGQARSIIPASQTIFAIWLEPKTFHL